MWIPWAPWSRLFTCSCSCNQCVHCLGHRLGKRVGAEYRPDAFRRSGWEHPRCEYWPAPCRNTGRFQCGCLGLLGAACSHALAVVSSVRTVYLHCVCALSGAQAGKASGSRVPAGRLQALWLGTPPLRVPATPLLSKLCVQYFYHEYGNNNNGMGWYAYAFMCSEVTG